MRCQLLQAGTVTAIEAMFKPGGGLRLIKAPSMFALLEHPTEGPVLFDSGYSPRFLQATRRLPYSLYGMTTPVHVTEAESAHHQLCERGIDPRDVRWLVLSHFDPDHYGGLMDFPNARIVCHRDAWEYVRGKTGFAGLLRRILPGHLPDDLAERLMLIDTMTMTHPMPSPLPTGHDLFGDGRVVLLPLRGHAPGHLGALITTGNKGPMLLAADACWHCKTFEGGPVAGRAPRAAAHVLIAHDKSAQRATYGMLAALRRETPELPIIPSHCPDTAARWLSHDTAGPPR